MSIDYVSLANTALRLVTNAGREITFRRYDADLQNTDQPWGPANDLRGDPEEELTLNAVTVHPTDVNDLGVRIRDADLMKFTRKLFIVAPGSDVQSDLSEFQEVVDGSETFKITMIDKLQPGDTILLWYVGVAE